VVFLLLLLLYGFVCRYVKTTSVLTLEEAGAACFGRELVNKWDAICSGANGLLSSHFSLLYFHFIVISTLVCLFQPNSQLLAADTLQLTAVHTCNGLPIIIISADLLFTFWFV